MKLIAYYRVSTKRQGASGLGLEAQKASVLAYAKSINGKILAEYTEVESGKKTNRPELAKALNHSELSGAIVVIAKMDRLIRNVPFLYTLMEAGVEFVACDYPNANRLTVKLLAVFAEEEAIAISERTIAALAALKARGVKLGSARPGHWDNSEDRRLEGAKLGNERSAEVRKAQAQERHDKLCPKMMALKAEGLTLQAIAEKLNSEGLETPRGKPWSMILVHQFLTKCKKVNS